MTELFTMIVLTANAVSAIVFANAFKDRVVARIPKRNRGVAHDAGGSPGTYRLWPRL
jgi:hypothetical protein